MDKLGPRILHRLPGDALTNIVYYGGDGSQKYIYDPSCKTWEEDSNFKRVFSEAQTKAVLSIIEKLKLILAENGYNPEKSETYLRGGSVSWMMLGDISAEPYREPKAAALRFKLIDKAKKLLKEQNYLRDLGAAGLNTDGNFGRGHQQNGAATPGVTVPFPGARGIKFVLEGNNKERAARDFIESYRIKPRHILFVGNELFEGGNDNMMRNISGVTLLSVGEREDLGEQVISGGIKVFDSITTYVEANRKWLDWVCSRLELGYGWEGVLHTMHLLGSEIFSIIDKVTAEKRRKKSPSHSEINAIFFDKGGTLSYRVSYNDNGISDIKKIMRIVGAQGSAEEFRKEMLKKDNDYKNWSLQTEIEAD